jgi:NAD(P)-dependent dehydrogenase (short-subunit alcohol dehydrogenase family)
MGAATKRRLEEEGSRVIGVDVRDADVVADLATPEGRAYAVAHVTELSGGVLDGAVTFAGLSSLTELPGSLLVSVNYFGTVEVLSGLRPLLARGTHPAAVAISSNSSTCSPAIDLAVAELCLAHDEAGARAKADVATSLFTYPATKLAVARWVRRNAADWAAEGITLNAIAPGTVETPMLAASRSDPTIGAFIDDFPVPVGRPGTAEELAGVTSFLLGPDARFISGSVLVVDGGTDALLRTETQPTPWVEESAP